MNEPGLHLSILTLIIGTIVALAVFTKAGFSRLNLPPLIGYIALGFLIRLADAQWDFVTDAGHAVFEFLMRLGIIALLFRIGLESKLMRLLKQMRTACIIWGGDVVCSAGFGFLVARYVLGLTLLQSAVTATALTATSVGIPVRLWRNAGALDSPNGERFLDVAELDDITGVVLMALLFALLPILQNSPESSLVAPVAITLAKTAGGLIVFGVCCLVFSRFAEERLTSAAQRLQPEPAPMLVVAGTGFVIAALAALLGFSMAIGAFFAGLAFSRDPERVHIDAAFASLYEFLTPFFFVGIGLSIVPEGLGGAVLFGAVLFVVAVLGKLSGVFTTSLLCTSLGGAALLAVSMIPRAEIAMVVMKRAHEFGEEAAPDALFSAMVLVTALTSTIGPLALHRFLKRTHGNGEKET